MGIFYITDVIDLLNLPRPPHGKSAYYIQCPCCDDKPKGRHLNINIKKNVFRCPRCGVSGGVFDLYSLYTGLPRDNVRSELEKHLGFPNRIARKKKHIEKKEVPESPLAGIKERHQTYRELLSMLSLSKDHKKNLTQRGFTDHEIEQFGYRTAPVVGLAAITKKLKERGCTLAGVPGFYRTREGEWSYVHEWRGILIPIRSPEGLIQGLQIRRDIVSRRKFRWISSAGRTDGCGAEGWTHVVGKAERTVILTEGAMKADLIYALTSRTVIALPGVNALTHLEKMLSDLKDKGVQEIKIAFDMDFLMNPHVQNGLWNLMMLLWRMNLIFGCYLWNPEYKGLDDYIWEFELQKNRKSDTEGRIV